jgi:hypothetical protein
MIIFFSIFEVMKPQRNFIKESYDSGEYKPTWMLVVTFSVLHVDFIYIKHIYFTTLMKYLLELL